MTHLNKEMKSTLMVTAGGLKGKDLQSLNAERTLMTTQEAIAKTLVKADKVSKDIKKLKKKINDSEPVKLLKTFQKQQRDFRKQLEDLAARYAGNLEAIQQLGIAVDAKKIKSIEQSINKN